MKKLFQSKERIPSLRLLLYLLILGTVPIVLGLALHYLNMKHLEACKVEMEQIAASAWAVHHKGWQGRIARKQFQGADRFFVDKRLETLRFLEEERQALHALVETEPHLPNREVVERLEFLEGDKNRLRFTEGMVQSFADVRETMESLAHPVEVSPQDLETLLQLIEGEEAAAERPQLIVSDLEIRRRASKCGNEVFVLDLKLIKREYSCDL